MKTPTETMLQTQYTELLITEKQMLKHSKDKDLNTYFQIQERLKEQLKQFLKLEFTDLPKAKFLHLCDLVSTHRPVAPFSFLVSISMRKK